MQKTKCGKQILRYILFKSLDIILSFDAARSFNNIFDFLYLQTKLSRRLWFQLSVWEVTAASIIKPN